MKRAATYSTSPLSALTVISMGTVGSGLLICINVEKSLDEAMEDAPMHVVQIDTIDYVRCPVSDA